MPIDIVDVCDGQGNLITGHGEITDQEVRTAFESHLRQDKEKFRKYRYSLSDYTGATALLVEADTVRWVAQLAQEAAQGNPDAVVAIVADQDFVFAMARMWELTLHDIGWEIMVFRDRHKAEGWLRKRTSELYDLEELELV